MVVTDGNIDNISKSHISPVFELSVSLREVSDQQQHGRLRCPGTQPSCNYSYPCHISVLVSQSIEQRKNPKDSTT